MDKSFWVSISKSDYSVPEGHTLENLTNILFSYLGSTDPELRDEIAYIVYANWLKRGMYSSEVVRSHVDMLLANLDKGIGEIESDTVFLRAFSILLLAEIVHNDNKKPLLDQSDVKKIFEKGIWYFGAEKDPRGHVAIKGWAHALAHTADLMLVLARNRYIDAGDLWSMLATISHKVVHSTNHVYIHREDERLADAVIEILRRDLISLNQLDAWVRSLTHPDDKDWTDAWSAETTSRAFHNTRNLLRSTYFAVIEQLPDFPERESIKNILYKSVTEIKTH
jgi:hypothetical protein